MENKIWERRNYDLAINTRDDKTELCEKAIKNCEVLIKALGEIKNGYAESRICKKYGINKGFLRRLVFSGEAIFGGKEPGLEEKIAKVDDKNLLMSGGERLYARLTGKPSSSIPYDVDDTMEYCLKHSNLSNRETKVVRMRYYEEMTLEEVAKVLGVTRERVRQVESKALCILQRKNKGLLEVGADAFGSLKRKKYEEYLAIKELNRIHNEELKKKIDELEEAEKEFEKVYNEKVPNKKMTIDVVTEYGASVRLYNIIKRSKINGIFVANQPISFFDGKTREEVMSMRNLGRKTYEEFLEILHKEGIYLADEKATNLFS